MANLTEGYWCNKLRNWEKEARKNGLIGLNFFIGSNPVSLEEAAREVYEVLSGNRKTIDITGEIL
jgi:hypothetical protein